MHVVAYGSRDADSTRRALGLKSCRHIHCVPVEVSAIGYRVAKVDADPKPNGAIRRSVSIMNGDLLLHLHSTAHRAVDAVEYDEQGIAPSLDDPAAMLINRGIDHLSA